MTDKLTPEHLQPRAIAYVRQSTFIQVVTNREARNGSDWHHLNEFCQLVGTVLIDPEGTYAPRLT